MAPAFEWAKTVHTSDRAETVIGIDVIQDVYCAHVHQSDLLSSLRTIYRVSQKQLYNFESLYVVSNKKTSKKLEYNQAALFAT
jgi:hypothetical protein